MSYTDQRETIAAFEDPQVGDRFHEMFSFWVYVLHVGERVIVAEGSGHPSWFPDLYDGSVSPAQRPPLRIRIFDTPDDFRAQYRYKTAALADKYMVLLCDRGNDVEGWLERCAVA